MLQVNDLTTAYQGLVAVSGLSMEVGRGEIVCVAGANGAGDRMSAKLVTGRFFVERMLPETGTHLARIQSGAASTMELPPEAF